MLGSKGEIVGSRYHLETLVGTGGGGVVWTAQDTELSRVVAVKLLPSDSQEHKSRIWREARLAALLSTSGAVPVFDFGDDGDHCFLVMEYVEAPTLRTLLEVKEFEPLALPDLLSIGISLLGVLQNAHQINIIHRDIKPENMFVAGSLGDVLTVRLVDFGLAFLGDKTRASLGRLSDDHSISGTPGYLSPEQAQGNEISTASDIYSSGCVLYEMACGDVPFSGSVAEILGKHIYVPPIPVVERNPQMPKELGVLISRMLAKAPDDRPSIEEIVSILVDLQTDQKPWKIGRSKRSTGGLARADRVLAATAHAPVVKLPPILVSYLGSPPDSFHNWIQQSGLQWVDNPDNAACNFADPSTSLSRKHGPVIAWIESIETLNISKLIRQGFADVIASSSPRAGIAHRVHRLIQSEQRMRLQSPKKAR